MVKMEGKKEEVLLKKVEEEAIKNDVGGLVSTIYRGDKKVYPETEKTEETLEIPGIRRI